MTKYVYDTSAIYDFLEEDASVAAYFSEDDEGVVTLPVAMEVYFVVLKNKGNDAAVKALDHLYDLIVQPSKNVIQNAMQFRLNHKAKGFSYADALGYQLALYLKIPFVTSDSAFKEFPNVAFVKRFIQSKE